MLTNKEFVCCSLNTHLFFARIMKEHAMFLEMGFMPISNSLYKIACKFNCDFSDLLLDTVRLSDGHIGHEVMDCGEIVTKFTLDAEEKSFCMAGTVISSKTTILEKQLDLSLIEPDERLIHSVKVLNEKAIHLLENFVSFKEHILGEVNQGNIFTFNYPLLIDHLLREAKHYLGDIKTIDQKDNAREHEIFWGTLMSDHAKFIRGLLDPSEDKLIHSAHETAESFDTLLKKYKKHPEKIYIEEMIKNTELIKAFKEISTDKIIKCEIKSVIVPILADHVLRESNHFLRLLNEYSLEYNDNNEDDDEDDY